MSQYKNIAKAKAIERKNRERLLKVNNGILGDIKCMVISKI